MSLEPIYEMSSAQPIAYVDTNTGDTVAGHSDYNIYVDTTTSIRPDDNYNYWQLADKVDHSVIILRLVFGDDIGDTVEEIAKNLKTRLEYAEEQAAMLRAVIEDQGATCE